MEFLYKFMAKLLILPLFTLALVLFLIMEKNIGMRWFSHRNLATELLCNATQTPLITIIDALLFRIVQQIQR